MSKAARFRRSERAVTALKSGKQADLEKPLDAGPEVDLHVPALIPEDYVPDVHLRLVLYKRIASTPTREELDELKVELIDRFGPLPPFAGNLLRSTYLKLRAGALGIRKIDAGAASGYVLFEADNKVDPKRVLKLIQGRPKEYRLDGPLKLRFSHDARSEEKLFTRIEQLVDQLA
jgi:transcription-repair coupling factor (superfamily II helicase)